MFPTNSNSNSNGNGNFNDPNPMPYIDHSNFLLKQFGNNDINISSKQEDQLHLQLQLQLQLHQQQQQLPFPIFHFPSPYCEYTHFDLPELEDSATDIVFPPQHHNDLSLIHHPKTSFTPTPTPTTTTDNSVSASGAGSSVINMPDSSKNDDSTTLNSCTNTKKASDHQQQQVVMRKRPSKRDRHSKIKTAKGLRDRRMRLSLEVAREFFGLQDMLGYDKASKTVEWLLIQSRPEIKKLGRSHVSHHHQQQQLMNLNSCSSQLGAAKSPSSTSEGEVVSSSGIDKATAMEGVSIISKVAKPSTKRENKKQAARQPRKTALRPPARSRDLREKARERAKARTKAKIVWTTTTQTQWVLDDESNNNELNKLSSWSSFENTIEDSGTTTHDHNCSSSNNPSFPAAVAEAKELSSHHREQTRVNHGDIGDESWFTCLQNAGINQEHQFPSFLSFGKPWEG